MSEALEESPFQETTYFPHTLEGLAGLTKLEEDIVKSLYLDMSYGEDEVTRTVLDRTILKDALFMERLERGIKPKGFHGAVDTVEALVVPDLSRETFTSLYTYKTANMHRAVLLSLNAHARSSGMSDAGHFNTEVLYFTKRAPRLGGQVLAISGIESDFPVIRKVVSSAWEENSPFVEKQRRLAKMSDGLNPVRRGNGKVRRLPKHR